MAVDVVIVYSIALFVTASARGAFIGMFRTEDMGESTYRE